jgi:hypothetical protein
MVRGSLVPASLLCLLAVAAGCGTEQAHDTYTESPRLLRSVELRDGANLLQPLRLQVVGDSVFVVYKGIARIDVYNLEFERVGSLPLVLPEPVMPSAFAVNDSQMVVCDHTRGAVVVYDRGGNHIDSFGLLPDAQTRLSPLALAHFQGVAYVADMSQKQVLAISTASTSATTEQGELILRVPGAGGKALGFPSAVSVTPDGRLLVGDAGQGHIRVFTCDGQEIYTFDPVPGQAGIAPQGFAVDNVRDPGMKAATSFDPSGVRLMGRIHVADGRGARVHMYNPLGEYLGSYPDAGALQGPSDVGISQKHRRVFVVDSLARRILVFGYGEG